MYGVFFLTYKLLGGFAIVAVINGVFMHETFNVANSDPALMVIKEKRKKEVHLATMERLFSAADRQGRGALSFSDFRALLADPFVQDWLSSYELSTGDVEKLFYMMDDGDGKLTAEELLSGVSKLKGAARSLDVHAVKLEVDSIKASLAQFGRQLSIIERALKK